MTDETEPAERPSVPSPGPESQPAESVGSAREDELADSIEIDSAASRHDAADDQLPTAPSPEPRPPRASESTALPQADLTRLDAAHRGEALPDRVLPATASDLPVATEPEPPLTGRAAKRAANAKRPRRKAPWWELPVLIAVAIGIAILVKTFVVQPFYIPSASMEKTLYGATHGGDRILVNKPIYDLRDPHPGDIVVFNAPAGWDDEPGTKPPSNPVLRVVRGFGQLVGFVPPDGLVLVKRVIATGGQTVVGTQQGVYVCSGNCALPSTWRAGQTPPSTFRLLDEPYVYESGPDPAAVFGPVTVPKGRLWVMGDHRDQSADSRYHCQANTENLAADSPCADVNSATVPVSDVIGKAVIIAWPPSRWRTLGTPDTFKHGAAALGSGLPLIGSALVIVPVYLVRRRRRRVPSAPR
jgi:signal peptidase I